MKDWNDFLPPDDENEFDNESSENERIRMVQKVHRLMFIDDIEKRKSQVVPLDPIEFIDIFGKPTEEDMLILTQCYLKDYMKASIDIYDKWGLDWMYEFLKFNEKHEEFEICAIIRDTIKDRPIQHLKDVISENIHSR
tara:strand:+ start:491 stop:904 length:414 start_codon:yes stop_codon:yes gene_type:complete